MESCQVLAEKPTLLKQVNSPGHPKLTRILKEQSKRKKRKMKLMKKDLTSLLLRLGKGKDFKIGNISMVRPCLGCTKVKKKKMEISITTVSKNTLETLKMVIDLAKENFYAQMDENTRVISLLATSKALIP
jgi:hypothetical protein